jgi:predicted amidohydrolase YtcJ
MPQHADLIVANARILIMDEANPRAEAIAVRDGTIVAVGDERSIASFKEPATKPSTPAATRWCRASSKRICKGRLKPGYLGDLVVLSGDLETADLSGCTTRGRPPSSAVARSSTGPDPGTSLL